MFSVEGKKKNDMSSKIKNLMREKWMLSNLCVYVYILLLLLLAGVFLSERLLNTIASRQFNESEWMDLLISCFFPPLPTSLSPESVC